MIHADAHGQAVLVGFSNKVSKLCLEITFPRFKSYSASRLPFEVHARVESEAAGRSLVKRHQESDLLDFLVLATFPPLRLVAGYLNQ